MDRLLNSSQISEHKISKTRPFYRPVYSYSYFVWSKIGDRFLQFRLQWGMKNDFFGPEIRSRFEGLGGNPT